MVKMKYDDVFTVTLENRSKEMADNISKNNALLTRLKDKGKMRPLTGGAKILEELEILKSTGLLLLGVCVFCTVITFAITGFTVTLLQKLMNGKEKKR